jgi:O-acetyl-ADP-ribose deacetylase (regulator of RNase III)
MITYVQGSIFTSPAQVLVNTVNAEGVMGKGIALQFKRIYPEMFSQYQELCEFGKIDPGILWIYKTPHKWILNFPTKKLWRQPSRIEYIEKGLKKFVSELTELKIHSIAFPALGCGNGELDWEGMVKPVMERYLTDLPVNIFIHPPLSHSEFPEHWNQKEVAEWLRSEPRTLAFSEVWTDLKLALKNNAEFSTGTRPFTAKIEEDLLTRTLVVTTENRPYRISYDELREVWSAFRTLGYLRRGFVTNRIEKVLYYIMPVLAQLPYVETIRLLEKGRKKSYQALQYIASPESVNQPTLFS